MDGKGILLDFLNRIEDDPIMNVGHIAVYVAVFKRWLLQDCTGPVKIHRKQMMTDAKISSSATYFRKIRELAARGYIAYFPEHCNRTGSFVRLDMDKVGTKYKSSHSF